MNVANHITQFSYFTENELNHLKDEEIICGFRQKNPQIT